MSRAVDLFSVPTPTTTNKEGFDAYERSLEERYLQCLLTNTLSNTFYTGQKELMKEADALHNQMLAKDPVFMAKALAFARSEGYMRLQPIVGLTKMSGVREFELAFPEVIQIPSDLAEFSTIIKGQGHGEGGRMIKRCVSKFLNRVSQYWALKYSGRGRGYNLKDAIATSHPKPRDERQKQLFRYILGKKAKLTELTQLQAYENFKIAKTNKERVHWITEGKLHYELVTNAGDLSKDIWNAILKQMPIFALLRHLNALERAGVLEMNRDYIVERFSDAEALQKSKILPFQFLKAFDAIQLPWVKDVIRQAIELTFVNMPDIPGVTAVFMDISESMNGKDHLKIGSIFSLALFKKTKGNGVFWLFDTGVYDMKASMHDSILSQAAQIRTYNRGTDTGAPLQVLLQNGIKVDNIIMITDEQQNAGRPFYQILREYRSKINSKAKCFMVDINTDGAAMAPVTDKLTHYIYGWSDQILDYIGLAAQGFGSMVDHVKRLELGK